MQSSCSGRTTTRYVRRSKLLEHRNRRHRIGPLGRWPHRWLTLPVPAVRTDRTLLSRLRFDVAHIGQSPAMTKVRSSSSNRVRDRRGNSDIGGDRAHSGDGPDDRVDRPVELRFANGVVEHAELVVAADGFDSTVRRRLFGPVDATYSGYVGWRGMVVESDLTSNTFDQLADAISYSVIPSSHIVAYPIPTVDGSVRLGERLVNYVWYRNVAAGADLEELMTGTDGNLRMASLHPGAVQARFIAEMKHAAEQLAPVMTEVVQRTPEPFLQVIQDIETPKMATARVALLGDGAFSARPHAAAGTAKAAEDGWKLIEALETHDTIPEALRHWERGQLELGRQLVARTRDLGERSQFRNTWTPGDPELAFGLFGPGH
jgi:2,6-dihydroxypyridine 3-monooxygenase